MCFKGSIWYLAIIWDSHSTVFVEQYAIITLKLKKIVTLIHSVWNKMLYYHSVVLKGWCEVECDFLCHTTSSRSQNIGMWEKTLCRKQLKHSDCSMLLHSYLNLHGYFPISKDSFNISGKCILGPVCKQLFHIFPKRVWMNKNK